MDQRRNQRSALTRFSDLIFIGAVWIAVLLTHPFYMALDAYRWLNRLPRMTPLRVRAREARTFESTSA